MKAVWNGETIAETDKYEVVEGTVYFPKDSVKEDYLKKSDTHTICPWKGTASYYTLDVNGETNDDAAWYYPEPSEKAANIKDHIAFWRGVEVTDS